MQMTKQQFFRHQIRPFRLLLPLPQHHSRHLKITCKKPIFDHHHHHLCGTNMIPAMLDTFGTNAFILSIVPRVYKERVVHWKFSLENASLKAKSTKKTQVFTLKTVAYDIAVWKNAISALLSIVMVYVNTPTKAHA